MKGYVAMDERHVIKSLHKINEVNPFRMPRSLWKMHPLLILCLANIASIAFTTSSFVILSSPYLNKEMVWLCNRYQIACMPGAMTIREVVECMEAGADIVKIFPGELFGLAIIKAIKSPISHAPLIPTGGASLDNVSGWIKAGTEAVGVGGNLAAGAKKGDYESISKIMEQYITRIKSARKAK